MPEQDPTVGSYFFIPYTAADDGSRPRSGAPPFYVCPSIRLNGAPYAGALIDPNAPIDVSVVVANRGAVGAPAIVSLYWANPTTGFTGRLFASRSITRCPTALRPGQ